MVLIGKQFFTLDNYPNHIALDTRYWLLCNTPHWMQTPLQSPVINQIENLSHNLEEEVRNRKISSKSDLMKPLEEEWMKITKETTLKLAKSLTIRSRETIESKGGSTRYLRMKEGSQKLFVIFVVECLFDVK